METFKTRLSEGVVPSMLAHEEFPKWALVINADSKRQVRLTDAVIAGGECGVGNGECGVWEGKADVNKPAMASPV
jgi:hypothetical protein